MATKGKLNVVIVSAALQGHINPSMRLAKLLISKGIHVTIVTTEMTRDRMLKKNVSSTLDQNPQNEEIEFEFFSDGLSLDFDRDKDMKTFVHSLDTIGSKNLSTLIINLTKINKISCIIVDPLLHYAINIAGEYDIPSALFWIQPCALYSISYRFYKKINQFPNLEDPNEIIDLPGIPLIKVKNLPSYMLPSTPLHIRQVMVNLSQSWGNVKWTLANSFYELELEAVNSMNSLSPIYPIGPLVSEFMFGKGKNDYQNGAVSMNLWNTEDSCFEWLDDKPISSVIYISFGSVVVLSQEQVDNIATALTNSGKSFLWVIKPPEKGSEAVTLSRDFLEETKGRGLVVTWCRQEKVLMHPSVGCFLSHCGWNSVLESVAAGVPIIGYPKWVDQPSIAKLIVERFRDGIVVNFGDDWVASVEEIERCIKEVMDGASAIEMKNRASEMKQAVRNAVANGGSSDKNINQFISDLMDEVNLARTSN